MKNNELEEFKAPKHCKYCSQPLKYCLDEGLKCSECEQFVHLRCLDRGSVPGSLQGDIFWSLKCKECSSDSIESFTRNKMPWMQAICLVLFHLQSRSPFLARKGFFHWSNHIRLFIDKNWSTLFSSDIRKKKNWHGTIAGTLSHFSNLLFLSGSTVFNEPAWWTLMYPKLSPYVTSTLYSILMSEKHIAKVTNQKRLISDSEWFGALVKECIKEEELTKIFDLTALQQQAEETVYKPISVNKKRKSVLPKPALNLKKMAKLAQTPFSENIDLDLNNEAPKEESTKKKKIESKKLSKLLDPFCHYNTSLNNISRCKSLQLQVKLLGGIRKELILSPYTGVYLKPYIRRDFETNPVWLQLMLELQIEANKNNEGFVMPKKSSIDYSYVQPEHIPAINSLCNQFFWPGIDMTECLQYPDFSCVVLYKKLIVGFGFVVPNVNHTENYISFIFTRPSWRNCGIAKFILYHLIQTSLGKDLTLHVSINNPALFLYQKFGFKVEKIVLGFYDKYYRGDVGESKNAFFCRLER